MLSISPIKYPFIFLVYLWLRFDPALRLAFKNDWTPRYEFLATIFGETDAEKFLQHRVKLVKARNKKIPPVIYPKDIETVTNQFIKSSINSTNGRKKRITLINRLFFWATDPEINRFNIDSYKTRTQIVDSLLNIIFQNSTTKEIKLILTDLKKIVFSRITYLGKKGEPSPIVHDTIISGVSRILISHFYEVIRLRDQKTDKSTKIKLIKEIQKSKGNTGSLSFSGDVKYDDSLKHKFPLSDQEVKLLVKILNHYRFSAWPDSREKAQNSINRLENELGFDLKKF